MYRKKGRGWTKHIDFMLIDIACIVIAFFISYVIRFGFNNPYVDKDYRILGVAFLLIDFFVEIMADSFKNVLKRGYLDEFISTCKHAVLVFLVTALFLFTTQMADIYSRLSFYIMFPIYVTITYVARLALKSFLKKKGFGASRKSLFVIAPDAMLRDTLCTVEKSCIGYTKIVAASLDTDMKGMTICGIPIVANHDGIVDYACDEWVDEVLIPPCSEDEYPERMADIFLEMGIAVHTGITKNGTAQGGYKQIEKIGDYTVVTSSVNYANTSALLVKRGMDIVGGLVGCLFTLIIMIFVGPMIYIASPGPIFFAQERVGRNGRKFKMYKFRSMYMDAEERKKELAAQNKVGDGMMFKMDFDPRIIGNKLLPNGKKKTGIGQFIRKTSLDEFPQFFNILVGDMSLVGTRPPTLDEWEKYEPHHRARMSFRPGLTGLWQVSGRSNITDFEEVVKLDTNDHGKIVEISHYTRKILKRKTLKDNLHNFYCYYPILYRGNLVPVQIPRISVEAKITGILRNIFKPDNTIYTKKYIFFTSVYDFEGGNPIGEYELVCKVAKLVGIDNLLVKTHPRDSRTIYKDHGFNVDVNSSIPWEAIQLSGDFSDKVFLTINSGSVLSGSTMSEKPVKTFYMYKLCDIKENKSCQKNAQDIEALLCESSMKEVFRNVRIAEKIEDIL